MNLEQTLAAACVAVILSMASSAVAQAPPDCAAQPDALVADLGLHVINAGYQRTLGCGVVLQASAGLYAPWTVNDDVLGLGGGETRDVTGAVLRMRAFFFPGGGAPAGLWASPFVQGGWVSAAGEGGLALAGGASVGWTWWLGSHVLLALGLGAQVHTVMVDGSTDAPGFARFGPTVDINVDYVF